jgi:hypothetical protein
MASFTSVTPGGGQSFTKAPTAGGQSFTSAPTGGGKSFTSAPTTPQGVSFSPPTTKPTIGANASKLLYPSDNTDNAKARVVFKSFNWKLDTPRLENTQDPIISGGESSNIQLYVPGQFSEKYSAQWGMDKVLTFGLDVGLNQALKASAFEAAESMTEERLGAAAVNTIKMRAGSTQFPGEFLVFHKGDPIQMGFHFELLPRSSAEAAQINNIVTTFKTKLLPTLNGGLLDFPDLWNIYFSGINGVGFPDTPTRYLYMALIGVNAQYSGGNQSALVYHDNFSVMITLDLQFHSVRNAYINGAS